MLHRSIIWADYEAALHDLTTILDQSDTIDCQIDFSADHSQSKIIRDFIGQIFDLYTVDQPWKGRFILIADELINNAIEHGSIAGDTDFCVIHAGRAGDRGFHIVFEVHDTGNGKDAKDATHMNTIKEDRTHSTQTEHGVYMANRGRGLFHITEKLVDSLSFSESPHGGLAVRIEKTIQ